MNILKKIFCSKDKKEEFKYFVCSEHFPNGYLQNYIETKGDTSACSFCQNQSKKKVLEIDELVEVFSNAFLRFFAYDNETHKWCRRFVYNYEIYQGLRNSQYITTEELINISSYTARNIENTGLFQVLIEKIENNCKNKAFSVDSIDNQDHAFDWSMFSFHVKEKRRYTFLALSNQYHKSAIVSHSYHDILFTIGKIISTTLYNSYLSKDISLFRSREIAPKNIKETYTFDDITSPPMKFAGQCRMSPAGISMFYASFSKELSTKECIRSNEPGSEMIVGEFRLKKPILILDLSILNVPSFFDQEYFEYNFLYLFHKEITKPMSNDDKVDIDYVPSQIVTEYFRWMYRTNEGLKIHGIIFNSSKDSQNKNVVLFYDNNESKQHLDLLQLDVIRSDGSF